MAALYDKFAPFYDLEYDHKDDDLDFYLDLAQETGSPVLEIGAGTGRITIPLAEEGHTVWGVDNSSQMLDRCAGYISQIPKKIAKNINLVQTDMRDFFLDKKFPLCIIPFRAFLHNLTLKDQISTLNCINRHLLPGGILALDLFVPLYQVLSNREWKDEIQEDELAYEKSGVSILCRIKHDPVKQLLNIFNTYKQKNAKDKTLKMVYRYIFRYEMELLLKLTGFQLEYLYGDFQKQHYDYYSGLSIFIARKINE
ncbi:class I SAM-dependent methyltransferase [candidate division KSB1 bacterium]|nr:class I SAM-dependent methyltransferase [candidate division KSB1 bacterium]